MSCSDVPTVISLGYRCEVAYQVSAIFGARPALPFDWLFTPLGSIQPMLEEGFQQMLDPRWLEPFEMISLGRRYWIVFNRRYQVLLPHAFPLTPEHSIVTDWREHIPEVAAKWARQSHRWRKTLAAGGPVVFVRRGGDLRLERFREGTVSYDPLDPLGPCRTLSDAMLTINHDFDDALQPTPVQAYRDLFKTLAAFVPDCRLLVVDPGCDLEGTGILTASVGPTRAEDWPDPTDYWKGSASAWGRALGQIEMAAA